MIKLQNEKVTIRISEGIMFVVGTDEIINKHTAQSVVNYRLTVSKGELYPILSDLRMVKKITKEAQDFFSTKQASEDAKAVGVLVKSALQSAIANFFLKINKPLVPVKLFTHEEIAIKWLKQFVNQDVKV